MFDFIIKNPGLSLKLSSKKLTVISPEDISLIVSGSFDFIEFSLSYNSLYLDIVDVKIKDAYLKKSDLIFNLKENLCFVSIKFNEKISLNNVGLIDLHVIPKQVGSSKVSFVREKNTTYQDGLFDIVDITSDKKNTTVVNLKSLLINNY